MKALKHVAALVLAILFSLSLLSCSGGGGSGKKAKGESIDDPGASVDAMSFQDAYPIELQIQASSGDFVQVHDGQYVEPGNKRLAAHVQGDISNIDKVFFCDGGMYQVEAIKQDDTYQADFTFNNDRIYSSVLVQVIHKNQKASKEKFVFKTFQDIASDRIILDGIGVLISKDLLNENKNLIASKLDEFVGAAFDYLNTYEKDIITDLSYGYNNPDKSDIDINTLETVHNDIYPSAVIHLIFTIHSVNMRAINLYSQDLISTNGNDLKVEMYLPIEDMGNDGKRGLIFNLLGSPQVTFQKDFFLRSVIEQKIASSLKVIKRSPLVADLQTIFDKFDDQLPLSITVNNTVIDVMSLLDKQNIDLMKYLFIDLYGVPENTSSSVLALGTGLYVADKKSVLTSTHQNPSTSNTNLNGIITDLCKVMVDEAFQKIKEQYKGLVTNMTYGDNDPQTPDFVINSLSIQDTGSSDTKSVQANFTVKKVDLGAISLFGLSLIKTQDNDLTINASYLITATNTSGGYTLALDVQDVTTVNFTDYFLGKLIVEELAKNTIKNLENLSTNIESTLASVSFDLDLSEKGSQQLNFPDVQDILSPYAWNLRLPQGCNMSLIISQDNINWALAQLYTSGFEWNIYEILNPILGEDFAGFNNNQSNTQETIMRFSVPPVLDLRSSQIRMEVDDIILEYRLNDQSQWQASVDLDLVVDAKLENNELAFYISSIPEKCHFHVMKDNIGKLGIFDHSNLINDITNRLPTILGKSPGDPVFTIKLDSFDSFIVFNTMGKPLEVSAADGYLYIDIDALDVDFSWLKDFAAKI